MAKRTYYWVKVVQRDPAKRAEAFVQWLCLESREATDLYVQGALAALHVRDEIWTWQSSTPPLEPPQDDMEAAHRA